MSAEQNEAIVRRIFDEIINKGNLAVADETLTSDYVYRSPGSPEFHGTEGFKDLITMYRTACPDIHLDIDELITEHDTVVTRWTGRGTQLGEFIGIPPTGKQLIVTGVLITHFRDGKAAEDWELMDMLGLLQQLGAVPGPEPAVATAR